MTQAHDIMFWVQPLIAAFTGWFTTWIAFFMLFHPRKPIHIFGLTIQGIFPKRQASFANKLGSVVGKELLHFDEIAAKIKNPENLASVMPDIDAHIDIFLNEKLKERMPMISMFVGTGTLTKIKEGLMEEITIMLPQIIGKYADTLGQQIDVERMVREKVANFSSDKLEDILQGVMKREFRFVEAIGGVFGFLIGVAQMLLSML